MVAGFRVRGVIEGFYGPPWSWAARRMVVSALGAHGGNAYVYAPKNDPYHRDGWRGPYPPAEMDEFAGLAEHCRASSIEFGFAISPGLDIDYDDAGDRALLLAKLRPFTEHTAWFVLALDDIRPRPGLGAAHASLVQTVVDGLGDARADVRITLVPTEYTGSSPSTYLTELSAGLPDGVDVMWTGPTVCSPVITAAHATARAASLGGRLPLVWDNYPVNDAMMAAALHLAPYTGRDPDLAATTGGVLLNPMPQARASLVAVLTALEFLADPASYDPMAAWSRALAEVGGDRRDAWRALGEACWASPLHPPSTVPLAARVDDDPLDPAELLAVAGKAEQLPAALAGDPAADEVMPWAQQAAREAVVVRCAAKLLAVTATAPVDRGRATHRAAVLVGAWAAARQAGGGTVFGPRFAAYPALDGDHDRLDVRAAVVEDASAVDRLARRALDAYEAVTK